MRRPNLTQLIINLTDRNEFRLALMKQPLEIPRATLRAQVTQILLTNAQIIINNFTQSHIPPKVLVVPHLM